MLASRLPPAISRSMRTATPRSKFGRSRGMVGDASGTAVGVSALRIASSTDQLCLAGDQVNEPGSDTSQLRDPALPINGLFVTVLGGAIPQCGSMG
jgi:hypothetical protein